MHTHYTYRTQATYSFWVGNLLIRSNVQLCKMISHNSHQKLLNNFHWTKSITVVKIDLWLIGVRHTSPNKEQNIEYSVELRIAQPLWCFRGRSVVTHRANETQLKLFIKNSIWFECDRKKNEVNVRNDITMGHMVLKSLGLNSFLFEWF